MWLQAVINKQLDTPSNKCGCKCLDDKNGHGQCHKQVCGIEHSDSKQAAMCPVSSPFEWPPLLQMPDFRAVRTDFTGRNRSFGEGMYVVFVSFQISFHYIKNRSTVFICSAVFVFSSKGLVYKIATKLPSCSGLVIKLKSVSYLLKREILS